VRCSPRRWKGPRTRLVPWPGSLWNIERREIEGETQLAANKRERWRSILHSMVRAWWNGGEVIWKNIVWKVWLAASSLLEFLLSWGDFSISIARNHRLTERVSKAALQNNNCALFASCSVPKCPPRKALHSSTVLLPGVSKRIWSGRSLLRIATESSY
jgi:hypothetical protein